MDKDDLIERLAELKEVLHSDYQDSVIDEAIDSLSLVLPADMQDAAGYLRGVATDKAKEENCGKQEFKEWLIADLIERLARENVVHDKESQHLHKKNERLARENAQLHDSLGFMGERLSERLLRIEELHRKWKSAEQHKKKAEQDYKSLREAAEADAADYKQRIEELEADNDLQHELFARQHKRIERLDAALAELSSKEMMACTPVEGSMEEILKIEFDYRCKFARKARAGK